MTHDPLTRWFAGTAAFLLTALLVFIVVASIRSPSIDERLDSIEQRQEFMLCLILVPIDLRNEAAVSTCVGP